MAEHSTLLRFRNSLAFVLTAGAVLAAQAATGSSAAKDTAYARYLQEKAACAEGRSHQDRATCMKEANNAYDEARRRPAGTPDSATLQRNAVERCARVKQEDQQECQRMALGQGKVSGSVEGGGVIKEIVTIEPGAPTTPR